MKLAVQVGPQFLASVCCVQMAAWIKMLLGMEVGLGPNDCVRWGPSFPLLNFQPMSIVTKRLDGSRRNMARRWASVKGQSPLPSFRLISVVAKRKN